ncbi:hypothetical protein AURDEDRAFT_177501 [Auricularia subglabra TFB-10046 SS5]|uniref:Uncharacterized protein n=1 Tax=Auricularia subglabra (strain TFB-10046 / SS5) TaxID=717982 RepID=J0WNI6_AURST|nr:hypothetical protein AURDEDRAFT_177501 [Auricularia subglabra TFB-10046 SS5]
MFSPVLDPDFPRPTPNLPAVVSPGSGIPRWSAYQTIALLAGIFIILASIGAVLCIYRRQRERIPSGAAPTPPPVLDYDMTDCESLHRLNASSARDTQPGMSAYDFFNLFRKRPSHGRSLRGPWDPRVRTAIQDPAFTRAKRAVTSIYTRARVLAAQARCWGGWIRLSSGAPGAVQGHVADSNHATAAPPGPGNV